jgi:uncharacterized surface protein with fasciclin (FAS1) repeats
MKFASGMPRYLGALALSISAATASATEGPFYDCLATPLVEFDGTVVDAAVATPELSTLVDVVVAAGLDGALATTDNITVYAPTNAAFGKIPAPLLNEIAGNPAALSTVLTYHVTPGIHDPRRWSTPVRRTTLASQPVHYGFRNGAAKVNSSTVSCQGVRTRNGVVWIIDSVLLPQF